MSYKWPNKDSAEVVDFSIDWSRFLGDTTISSVTWYIDDADGIKTQVADIDVVNGLQKVSQSNTTTVATIRLGIGTNNVRYKVSCLITTSQSLQFERSVHVTIKEK